MLIYVIGSAYAMHLAERGPGNPAWPQTRTTPKAPAPATAATTPAPESSGSPAATVTVTVTETVNGLPESCQRAIVLMRSVIEDINLLNSKSAVQLDIASAAHIAIIEKDWRALGQVQLRQRQLSQVQEEAYQDFKTKYKPALDALDQCEKDAK